MARSAAKVLEQVLVLGAATDATYEKGAKLLALMTYPAQQDATRRPGLQNALWHKALWQDHLANLDDETPVTAKPQYLFADKKLVESQFKRVGKAIEKRLMAGRIAMAFLKRIEQGDKLKLPPDVNRLTIDQMVDYVAETEGYKTSKNFETRVWRPARPVIHFAAALAAIGQERGKQEHQTSLNHLLADRELLIDVIERAAVFAKLIETDSHFPV